uniref:Uncharacterized protein n=1 Tax=Oryza rufipogon TaxID=4529 RepID=A0A0E0NZ14_ORYRU
MSSSSSTHHHQRRHSARGERAWLPPARTVEGRGERARTGCSSLSRTASTRLAAPGVGGSCSLQVSSTCTNARRLALRETTHMARAGPSTVVLDAEHHGGGDDEAAEEEQERRRPARDGVHGVDAPQSSVDATEEHVHIEDMRQRAAARCLIRCLARRRDSGERAQPQQPKPASDDGANTGQGRSALHLPVRAEADGAICLSELADGGERVHVLPACGHSSRRRRGDDELPERYLQPYPLPPSSTLSSLQSQGVTRRAEHHRGVRRRRVLAGGERPRAQHVVVHEASVEGAVEAVVDPVLPELAAGALPDDARGRGEGERRLGEVPAGLADHLDAGEVSEVALERVVIPRLAFAPVKETVATKSRAQPSYGANKPYYGIQFLVLSLRW